MRKVAAVFGADDVLLTDPNFRMEELRSIAKAVAWDRECWSVNITALCAYWRDHDESSSWRQYDIYLGKQGLRNLSYS